MSSLQTVTGYVGEAWGPSVFIMWWLCRDRDGQKNIQVLQKGLDDL